METPNQEPGVENATLDPLTLTLKKSIEYEQLKKENARLRKEMFYLLGLLREQIRANEEFNDNTTTGALVYDPISIPEGDKKYLEDISINKRFKDFS